MTIEPWAELGQTKEQFMAYLLDLTDSALQRPSACCHAVHASPANGRLAARPGPIDTAGPFNWRRHDDNQTEDMQSDGGAPMPSDLAGSPPSSSSARFLD
jgi:hypothetical protein